MKKENKEYIVGIIIAIIGFGVCYELADFIRMTNKDFEIGLALGFLIASFEILLVYLLIKFLTLIKKEKEKKDNNKL